MILRAGLRGQAVVTAVVLVASLCILGSPNSSLASRACGYFEFDKYTNTNSTLLLRWYDENLNCLADSWRAGSGTNTDTCDVGDGWLPNGWYDLWGHWNNKDGSAIDGRAWYVQDMQCSSGTWRTELFIHTEETVSNGQSCPTPGDDPHCWENTNDYKSDGCIKIAHPNNGFPNDIGDAHGDWHANVSSSHGSFTSTDRLYVHS